MVHSDSISPTSLGIRFEAPPEVGVEDLSDRGFGQTFPADPYSTLGSADVCPASSPAIGSNSPTRW